MSSQLALYLVSQPSFARFYQKHRWENTKCLLLLLISQCVKIQDVYTRVVVPTAALRCQCWVTENGEKSLGALLCPFFQLFVRARCPTASRNELHHSHHLAPISNALPDLHWGELPAHRCLTWILYHKCVHIDSHRNVYHVSHEDMWFLQSFISLPKWNVTTAVMSLLADATVLGWIQFYLNFEITNKPYDIFFFPTWIVTRGWGSGFG